MRQLRVLAVAMLCGACSSSSSTSGGASFAGTWACSGTETAGGSNTSYAETDTITENGSTLSILVSVADAGVLCTLGATVAGDVGTVSNETCSGFTIKSGSFTLSGGKLTVEADGTVNGATATSTETCTEE